MTRRESIQATGFVLAIAVVVLAIGWVVHLNPPTVAILVIVFSAIIGPPVAIRWAKRNRASTGD